MIDRFFRDSIPAGIAIGLVSISLNYILLFNMDVMLNRFEVTRNILREPRLQLIIVLVNIFLLRYLMVSRNRMQTGSGILIVLFVAMVWYLYNNRHVLSV
jgi:hypothetical protein